MRPIPAIPGSLVLFTALTVGGGCSPGEEELAGSAGEEVKEAFLVYGHTEPGHNAVDVDREISRVTVQYNSAIDCDNPIRGKQAFWIRTEKLVKGKRQEIFDQMNPFGGGPQLTCDPVRNAISMPLPGPLVGGADFWVDTRARGTDGSELMVRSLFRTENPGLKVDVLSIDNHADNCDFFSPFTNSENCDIYLVTQAKRDRMDATQENRSLPVGGGAWNDWSEHERKIMQPPVTLYMDAAPVGDPFSLQIHGFDADSGDGLNRVLRALNGVGKVASVWWPPAGVIGEGLGTLADALPPNGDDTVGRSKFFFGKAIHWGVGHRALPLEGRNPGDQVVLNVYIDEYPQSWFWELID